MPASRPIEERFWENVDKNGPIHPYSPELGRCWVWTASCVDGYGHIWEGAPSRKMLSTHRVSWELHNGPIPIGEGHHGTCVCHSCDNRKCVNLAHLYLDNNQGNIDDMVEKGRQARGENFSSSKLTEKQVVEARNDYVRGSRTHGQPALARKYGVDPTTIGAIVRGDNWK